MVLDPFFGSGTVGAVCQNLNRRFVGIELKAEFADIALKRLGWKDVRNESKRKRISGLATGTSGFHSYLASGSCRAFTCAKGSRPPSRRMISISNSSTPN
jgi:hypothetical protein